MGMKKNIALMSIMALAMSEEAMIINERGSVGSGKQPKPPEPKSITPFNKEEGISKMVLDYNLIKSGQSKKGKIKQARIISKIENYLKSRMLTEECINPPT